jgi:hypothetical protein
MSTRSRVKQLQREGQKLRRPILNEVPLVLDFSLSTITVTMSIGQWDGLLQAAYDYGANVLELDDNEKPVHLYRKDIHVLNE